MEMSMEDAIPLGESSANEPFCDWSQYCPTMEPNTLDGDSYGSQCDKGDEDDTDNLHTAGAHIEESQTSPRPGQTEGIQEERVGEDINVLGLTPIVDCEPTIGMEFRDEEEAYNYFNVYAKAKGFSVRKSRVERSRIDRRVLSRLFVCSNEGAKYNKDKRRKEVGYCPRSTKKTECAAAMRVRCINGRWLVDILELEHNHDLVDPKESFRLRSHQKSTKSTVRLIERLQRCGVTQSQIFTILKDFAGGEQFTGISDVRFQSLVRAKRRKSLGIDCQLALDYLESKRNSDPNFYYSISVNEDQQLAGLFWVDGRAREQYQWFGDVVVFDTTYRKNKYKFPFAPFTGVNHHMQCILFGCGLIADETKESFEWLFTTWIKAMQNIHPKSILTDEDPGILRAVGKVFPTTVHRLCAWHLEKHRLTHMGPLYRKFPGLQHMFYSTVYKSRSPDEFESNWETMIGTFKLENHKWLKKKFKIREHWVPCYFPDTFFAGMTTTQRAESMNNYFKGYFTSSTPINEFITQYEEAVRKRRGIETKADVNCLTSKPQCSTSHPIEMHAAEVYTVNVFNAFKEEWKVCLAVEIRKSVMDPPLMTYEVVFNDNAHNNNVQIVEHNDDVDETTCTCKLFEHAGLICKHILKVYVINDKRRIPARYILPRWTKAARYNAADLRNDVGAHSDQPQQQVWVLQDMAQRLVSEATSSNERYRFTFQGLANLNNDVLKLASMNPQSNNGSEQPSTATNSTLNSLRAFDPSSQSITRGRPNQSRITSTFDKVQHRRSYHCSACGKTGHNVVKCPQGTTTFDEAMHNQPEQPMQIDLNEPPDIDKDA